jgi:hypothetical protein
MGARANPQDQAQEVLEVCLCWMPTGKLAALLSDLTHTMAYRRSKAFRDGIEHLMRARIERQGACRRCGASLTQADHRAAACTQCQEAL